MLDYSVSQQMILHILVLSLFAVLFFILVLQKANVYFASQSKSKYQDLVNYQSKYLCDGIPVHFLKIDDLRIRYLQLGKKSRPHLILIHGIGASMYYWRKALKPLSEHFYITAFDLPGFGLSDKPEGIDYGLDAQISRIIMILNNLEINTFNLIGHSMGGAIATRIAFMFPERVLKLSLLAPAFSHKLRSFDPQYFRTFTKALKKHAVTPRLVKWIYTRACSSALPLDLEEIIDNYFVPYWKSPEAFMAFVDSNKLLRDPFFKGDLQGIVPPTQLFYGSKDRIISIRKIRKFLDANPKVQKVIYANSGHLLVEEHPEEIIKELTAFLES